MIYSRMIFKKILSTESFSTESFQEEISYMSVLTKKTKDYLQNDYKKGRDLTTNQANLHESIYCSPRRHFALRMQNGSVVCNKVVISLISNRQKIIVKKWAKAHGDGRKNSRAEAQRTQRREKKIGKVFRAGATRLQRQSCKLTVGLQFHLVAESRGLGWSNACFQVAVKNANNLEG